MKNLPEPRNGVASSPAPTVLVGAITALEAREAELAVALSGRRGAALRHHLLIVRQRLRMLRQWREAPGRRPPYWRAYVQDALDLIGKHNL